MMTDSSSAIPGLSGPAKGIGGPTIDSMKP